MNWKERAKVCRLQISATERFGYGILGGVEVKNAKGKTLMLNRTDWEYELRKANRHLNAKT